MGTDGVLVGAWAEAEDPGQILDAGTGSGLIALMLAQRFPQALVTGIELDPDSAVQAQQNAASSPFAERVQIIHGDFLQHIFADTYDLIVSNPPFFQGAHSSGNQQRDRARHEFSLPQKNFLQKSVSLLKPDGNLSVILPAEEARFFTKTAREYQLRPQQITKVFGSPTAPAKRYLLKFGFGEDQPTTDSLILRDDKGQFSAAYRHLTRHFYINF